MTYSTLTATAILMRAGNEDVLAPAKYSDAELLLLNKTAAKLEMELDLQAALAIDYDNDGSTLDEIVDNFSTRLSRALSYKQLALFYQTNDSGVDTKNRYRWELYSSYYEKEKQGFSSLRSTNATAAVSSTPIWR